MAKKRVRIAVKRAAKGGGSKMSVTQRRKLFAEAYMANGQNATQAAITAGLSAKTAYSTGPRMLENAEVQQIINERSREVAEKAELTTNGTLGALKQIMDFDPAEMYDANGSMIPIHKLPKHVRMALQSMKGTSLHLDATDDSEERLLFLPSEIKAYSRLDAIDKAMRHLGLFEKDNAQKSENVMIAVEIVG